MLLLFLGTKVGKEDQMESFGPCSQVVFVTAPLGVIGSSVSLVSTMVCVRYNPSIARIGTSSNPFIVGSGVCLDSRVEAMVRMSADHVKSELHRLEKDRLMFQSEVGAVYASVLVPLLMYTAGC